MSLADHPDVNEQTKQRIRQLSRRMGYQRLRRPPRSRTRHGAKIPQRIGFVLLGGQPEGDAHGFLDMLSAEVARQGMRMEMQSVPDPNDIPRRIPHLLKFAGGLDALILSGYADVEILDELEQRRLPHVILGPALGDVGLMPGRHGQIVTPDFIAMGERATSMLLREGHRRIAFICGRAPRGLQSDRWLRGYRRALLEAGITPDPGLMCTSAASQTDIDRAGESFANGPAPATGFVVPGAHTAGMLAMTLKQRGMEIDPAAMILGDAPPGVLNLYGLEQYRRIGSDSEQFAALIIHQLCQLYRCPLPYPAQLTVQFEIINPDTRH
jgi:LacI family transcriptional regulator